MSYYKLLIISFISITFYTSCESSAEKQIRWETEEKNRIEREISLKKLEEEKAYAQLVADNDRLEREAKERKEREVYDRYKNNSLSTGSIPYSSCFGGNSSCNDWGCSEINVRSPRDSDVVVTIKQNEKVVRHAYIKANSSYSFKLPNGTYQPFFYYGQGWNPEKALPSQLCRTFKGGFVKDEVFGKDSPQRLDNDILSYELILQRNGNFSTTPSNPNEMF